MSERLKAILTTTNSDTVSGTTILSDGTKAFWTEGRSSDVNVIDPSGYRWVIDATPETQFTSYRKEVFDVLSGGEMGPMRAATLIEECEHQIERNGGRS